MNLESRDVSEDTFLVEFPGAPDSDANRLAVSLADRLRSHSRRGLLDAIPGARTLFVVFDPRLERRRSVLERVRRLARERDAAPPESRRFRIPVAYGGESGPDLSSLARERGISPEELVRRHAAAEYTVAFLGFSPGFAYLSGLPADLAAPRRASPRPRVPAGSVAIGGAYTAIYPEETPGGWTLIGRSPVRLFDAAARPPALLRPGDRVSFEPIAEAQLRVLRAGAHGAAPAEETGGGADPLFEILAAGLFTTVQGAARYGFGASGVPAGGAMDPLALARGNALVGNSPGSAALEMTLSGPELLFRRNAVVCVTGAELAGHRNGRPVPLDAPFSVTEGDRLAFGYAVRGARAYLCVAGGLGEPRLGEPVRRLARGDAVFGATGRARGAAAAVSGRARAALPVALPAGKMILSVLPGPQRSDFPAEAIDALFSSAWTISAESDRRGVRLEGPALALRQAPDIPPEGTALGAIQVPANGQPIVLGPDRPVTGGYAKIGSIAARDWPLLAQAVPGSTVRFRPTSLTDSGEGTNIAEP
ncbi:MAG: 5-oxoprolinase subunit PxpB [Acidobacteriota bacterium]